MAKPVTTTSSAYEAACNAVDQYQRGQVKLTNKGENFRWGTTADGQTALFLSHLSKCFYVFHEPSRSFYRSTHPGSTRITTGSPLTILETDRAWLHPLIMQAVPAARELLDNPAVVEAIRKEEPAPPDMTSLATDEAPIEEDEDDQFKLPVRVVSNREIVYRETTKEINLTQEILQKILLPTIGNALVTFDVESQAISADVRWGVKQLTDALRGYGEEIAQDAKVEILFVDGRVTLRWVERYEGVPS